MTAYLAAHNVVARADLITLTLLDGTIWRMTTFQYDLVVGGQTFSSSSATSPYIVRGAFAQSAKLTIDTMDFTLTGTLGSAGLVVPLAVRGYFDGARLKVDHLIMPTPGDVSLGPIPSWFEGRVSGADPSGISVVLRVKSELTGMNVLLPKFLLQPSCGNVVYDSNCKVDRASYTIAGTVLGTPSASSLQTNAAQIIVQKTGYYSLGVLRFTSGILSGARRAVQRFTSDGVTATLTFGLPFNSAPAAGDGFTVYPGCDRSKSACLNKFGNLPRYRGFPHIPSPESGGGG